jgi:hypothetical protein
MIPDRLWQAWGRYLFWRRDTARGRAWHAGWEFAWMQARAVALVGTTAAILVWIARYNQL